MHWISYCRKARKGLFSNKYQLPCEIRFDSNVNGLFGQVLSILCVCICVCVCIYVCVCVCIYIYVCVCDSSGVISTLRTKNHEPCWQPAASAARNKTRNKCFMKQTYTSLPYFLVNQFAASSCFQSLRFFLHTLKKKKISHSNFKIGKYQTSPSYWCHRDFGARHWLARSIHIYLDNRSKKKKEKRGNK